MRNRVIGCLSIFIASALACGSGDYHQPLPARLGEAGQISLSSVHLEHSVHFYQKLGFQAVEFHPEADVPWALISARHLTLMLSENSFPSPSLTYFAEKMENRLPSLKKNGLQLGSISRSATGTITGVITTPEDLGISIIGLKMPFLPGVSKKDDHFPGTYSHLEIPSDSLPASIAFWEKLGYSRHQMSNTGDSQVFMSDDVLSISLVKRRPDSRPIMVFKVTDLNVVRQQFGVEKTSISESRPDLSVTPPTILMESPDGQRIRIEQIP